MLLLLDSVLAVVVGSVVAESRGNVVTGADLFFSGGGGLVVAADDEVIFVERLLLLEGLFLVVIATLGLILDCDGLWFLRIVEEEVELS